MKKLSAQAGLAPLIIILIVLVLLGGTAVAVNQKIITLPMLVNNFSNPGINQSASSSTPLATQKPASSATTSNNSLSPTTNSSISTSGTTKTGWSYSGSGFLTINPYLRGDRGAFYVDFESDSFNNVSTIYYNLNYDTDEDGTVRGVEAKFLPTPDQIKGYNGSRPYIRRELLLGTCSKSICRYDRNPRNFRLTVTSTVKDGTQYTQVLTLNKI